MKLREDALVIIDKAIKAVMPEAAVMKALAELGLDSSSPKRKGGKLLVIGIGKAAWNMAKATKEILGSDIDSGLVITKQGHSKGVIDGFEIIEAGHPLPDHHSVEGAGKAIRLVEGLSANDVVLLLISGGGSALFEKPLDGITLFELIDLTQKLLHSGADIIEMNTVRKHLSAVKGGRFAIHCGQAQIKAVILSDVVGNRLDSIASGPTVPDLSTSAEALTVIDKYGLKIPDHIKKNLEIETPKTVNNCQSIITGSVETFCEAAAASAERLGYRPVIITSTLNTEARVAGSMLAKIAKDIQSGVEKIQPPCAIIAGGETTVHVKGTGLGGRNQELALSASLGIEGLADLVIFSVGSDGTDGPTDAAGGMVDGYSADRIRRAGLNPEQCLDNNDAYHALRASGDLIMTGPTGTNVNDVAVVLCR